MIAINSRDCNDWRHSCSFVQLKICKLSRFTMLLHLHFPLPWLPHRHFNKHQLLTPSPHTHFRPNHSRVTATTNLGQITKKRRSVTQLHDFKLATVFLAKENENCLITSARLVFHLSHAKFGTAISKSIIHTRWMLVHFSVCWTTFCRRLSG